MRFEDLSVRDALESSLKASKHLRARDRATVAAARRLADRLDDSDGRTDHVLAGSFLKYLEALGLVDGQVKQSAPRQAKSAPAPVDDLAAMRKRVAAG